MICILKVDFDLSAKVAQEGQTKDVKALAISTEM